MYKFSEGTINNVADLLIGLKENKKVLYELNQSVPVIWYRGLRKLNNKHIPTFHRDDCKITDEIYAMNLFKQNAYESLREIPKTEWDWMFLVRHYGLPSRLLDWTENPIIGLYFAVRPRPNEKQATDDGVLWCLLPIQLNRFSLGWPKDSETIPMFTESKSEFSIRANEAILNYLPSLVRETVSKPMPPPAAGICPRTNQRMQRQMSVFTIHHLDKTPLEEVNGGYHMWRYKIPMNSKSDILEELKIMGITERTVFPDLDNVAAEVNQYLGGH